jgi:hypothetical protein
VSVTERFVLGVLIAPLIAAVLWLLAVHSGRERAG